MKPIHQFRIPADHPSLPGHFPGPADRAGRASCWTWLWPPSRSSRAGMTRCSCCGSSSHARAARGAGQRAMSASREAGDLRLRLRRAASAASSPRWCGSAMAPHRGRPELGARRPSAAASS